MTPVPDDGRRPDPPGGLPAEVVLVHGGFHGRWCWDRVAAALAEDGVDVHVPELPFTSLDDDIATVRSAVAAAGTARVLVCAHSYGGLVTSLALTDLEAVEHLVYLAAFMLDVRTLDAASTLASVRTDHAGWHPVGTSDGGLARLYHDCPPDDARRARARLRPMPERSLRELRRAARPPAYERVSSTYVVCTRDRVLDPVHQERMAERATHRHRLDCGHAPFFARPVEVAATLADIAVTGTPRAV